MYRETSVHKESVLFVVHVFYFSFHSFSFISTIRTRLLVLQRCANLMPFQGLGRTFKHTCTYRDSMLLLNIGISLISPLSFYFGMKGRGTNLKMPDNKLENKKKRLKGDQTEILRQSMFDQLYACRHYIYWVHPILLYLQHHWTNIIA